MGVGATVLGWLGRDYLFNPAAWHRWERVLYFGPALLLGLFFITIPIATASFALLPPLIALAALGTEGLITGCWAPITNRQSRLRHAEHWRAFHSPLKQEATISLGERFRLWLKDWVIA